MNLIGVGKNQKKYLIFPTLFFTIHLDNTQKNCKIENNLIIVFTLSFFLKSYETKQVERKDTMKRSWKLVVSLLAIGFMGCANRTETFNQADMVNVSKNGESAVTTKIETTTTTASPTKEGTTTTELNALAKEAIKEIETKKQVLLDHHYTILVQAQTKDSVDIHIRHQEQSGTSNFGFFRYTQSTKLLEEMDAVSGNYKPVK